MEEHFYLTLPLLALAVDRLLGRRAFAYLLPCAFFVPLLLRILTLLHNGRMPTNWYWMSHFHSEGMIAGVWLAYIFVEQPKQFARFEHGSRWLLPLIPLALIVVPIWHAGAWLDVTIFTVLAVGYSAWLCFLYGMRWQPTGTLGRAARWSVQALALAAYSLYLTHTTTDPYFRWTAESVLHLHRGVGRTLYVLATSLAVGAVFFLLIERPSILTRNRFLHHKKEQTLPAAA